CASTTNKTPFARCFIFLMKPAARAAVIMSCQLRRTKFNCQCLRGFPPAGLEERRNNYAKIAILQ
ncbi:MAG: hypothetical protein IKK20_03055, partial [Clostridia bacterium]|nr:hypothetical protein [Clostridia bacterium]